MKTTASHRRSNTRTTRRSRNGNGDGSARVEALDLAISPRVATWLAKPKHNLINGKGVTAESGETFEVFGPRAPSLPTPGATKRTSIARSPLLAAPSDRPVARLTPSERGKLICLIGDYPGARG